MQGIQNLLFLLNENWTSILVIIGLAIGIVKKTISYFTKTDDEKYEIAKAQIAATMLKMTAEAEKNYEQWNAAGSIKRSQVIAEIYTKYPILSKVANQEEVIAYIDEQIDEALKTLRATIKVNEIKAGE